MSALFVALALVATACENTDLTLDCGAQYIQIINAHYGRLEDNVCASNIGAGDLGCLVDGARDVVVSRSVIVVMSTIQ